MGAVIPLRKKGIAVNDEPCNGQCKRPGARPGYWGRAIPGTFYIIIHEGDCPDRKEP